MDLYEVNEINEANKVNKINQFNEVHDPHEVDRSHWTLRKKVDHFIDDDGIAFAVISVYGWGIYIVISVVIPFLINWLLGSRYATGSYIFNAIIQFFLLGKIGDIALACVVGIYVWFCWKVVALLLHHKASTIRELVIKIIGKAIVIFTMIASSYAFLYYINRVLRVDILRNNDFMQVFDMLNFMFGLLALWAGAFFFTHVSVVTIFWDLHAHLLGRRQGYVWLIVFVVLLDWYVGNILYSWSEQGGIFAWWDLWGKIADQYWVICRALFGDGLDV